MEDGLPLLVRLRGRRCLVVGGGRVAERRAAALVAAGAQVTVVAPRLTEGLASEARAGRLHWLPRPFAPEDVVGAWLVVVATDDPAVNAAAAAAARQAGALVNRADAADESDVHFPAVLRRGPLVLAVATGSHSPAFATSLLRQLGQSVGAEYGQLVSLLGAWRQTVRRLVADPALAGALVQGVAEAAGWEPLLAALRSGGTGEVAAALERLAARQLPAEEAARLAAATVASWLGSSEGGGDAGQTAGSGPP